MLRYDRQTKPGLVALYDNLWHPARKWSGSILTTAEPAWGSTKLKAAIIIHDKIRVYLQLLHSML